MKVVVVGAGAIGGLVGGLLAEDKKDVTVIGRQSFVEVVNNKGLKIKRIDGRELCVKPNVSAQIEASKGANAVLLCVKSQDTVEVCKSIKDYIEPETVIFSLQNGVRNGELINSVLKENRVVRTVVMFNSIFLNQGEIYQGSEGPVIVESVPWARPVVDYIDDTLKKAEAGCVYEDDIEGVLWSKLLFNQLNSIGAATNSEARVIFTNPKTSKIASQCLEEGKTVILNSGKHLKEMGTKSIEGLIKLLSMPLTEREAMVSKMFKMDAAIPSTLQSVLRGKRTEIEYLNGEIVRLAEMTGQKAPVNKALVDAVKQVEESAVNGRTQFFSIDELGEFVSQYKKL